MYDALHAHLKTELIIRRDGPDYEVTYPIGDRVAYVTVAYTASIVSGVPVADGEELGQVGWFGRDTPRETLRQARAAPANRVRLP